MAKTFKGKVDYKGISIENANEINRALTNVFNSLDVDKISGIKTISPKTAKGKKMLGDENAVFAYSPIEHGIYVNKDILKNVKTFEKYQNESKKSWDIVMSNIDKLKGSQKELALIYKNTGRSLVSGDTIEGLFTHELGHHVQWQILDTKTNNSIGANMSKYASKISGYANSSKGEYIAESFAAYVKGEKDILDKEFVDFLDKRVKKSVAKSAESGIIKSGAVSGALNPYSDRAEKHAEQYYEAVRKMTTDYKRIAKNTGYSENEIKSIKDFIFNNTHQLEDGKIERFDPSYEMAESWQRLIDGKNIQEHDLTMLKHEIMESRLMSEGYSQDEAHIITSRKYNYRKECDEYYGKINKYKQDKE